MNVTKQIWMSEGLVRQPRIDALFHALVPAPDFELLVVQSHWPGGDAYRIAISALQRVVDQGKSVVARQITNLIIEHLRLLKLTMNDPVFVTVNRNENLTMPILHDNRARIGHVHPMQQFVWVTKIARAWFP